MGIELDEIESTQKAKQQTREAANEPTSERQKKKHDLRRAA